MIEQSYGKDYEFARKICRELKSGKSKAIKEVHSRYQTFFLNFIRKRMRGYNESEDVLNDFWIELMNGTAICKYEGPGSLRTFLIYTLRYRIIDEIRRNSRKSNETPDSNEDAADGNPSSEKLLMKKQVGEIVNEALLELARDSAVDANRIRMYYLEELTYRQIAEQELKGENQLQKQVDNKTNAIKKRFTRTNGSKEKFKKILVKLMKKYGLDQRDLIRMTEL